MAFAVMRAGEHIIDDDMPPPFDASGFVCWPWAYAVGLALGSFVTMLSYRAPRNLSIISPPSHCPVCQAPLKCARFDAGAVVADRGKANAVIAAIDIGVRYVFD